MKNIKNYCNKVLVGDCIELMAKLPEASCDIIFADPPYNLQLNKDLYRPNSSKVNGVTEKWDQFTSFEEYDNFSKKWLQTAQKLLKKNGTIWVMGSYHNIFRLGKIMQDLGFWILNEITWFKNNPMPNFKGVRFTNSQETLIWAKRTASDPSYYFNYEAMKIFNNDLQMPSVWQIPICSGKERLKLNGKSLHPTQKPLALLQRVILASSKEQDLILDPFFGTGTTGVAAKLLRRNFIGIELEQNYASFAMERIAKTVPLPEAYLGKAKTKAVKVSLGNLLESNLIKVGETLFNHNYNCKAQICANGSLFYQNDYFSMHKLANELTQNKTNAWDFWFFEQNKNTYALNELREKYLEKINVMHLDTTTNLKVTHSV